MYQQCFSKILSDDKYKRRLEQHDSELAGSKFIFQTAQEIKDIWMEKVTKDGEMHLSLITKDQ